MSRVRGTVASTCGWLGVAALVLGVVFGYTARTFFNADTFAARVADGLAQPAVAHVVAEHITDAVIELRRDLTAYRPIIVSSVERIAASPAFRAVVRRAVREAHHALLSQAGRDITLSISDAGVIVRDALSTYPDVAARIPVQARTVLSTEKAWPSGRYLVAALRIAHRMRLRALVLIGLGLVMSGLGFALARDKQGHLIHYGLGLAAAALAVGLIARFGASPAAALSRSPVAGELVRALWPTFVQPLAQKMLLLAAIGLVPVAVGTSFLDRLQFMAAVRSAWNRVVTQPKRAGALLLRGVALAVFGGVIAFHPAGALVVLAVILGAILFFIGIRELLVVARRALPERVLEAAAHRGGTVGAPVVAAVTVVALVLIGAGALWLARDGKAESVAPLTDACNGHPELCGRPLNQVAFAATHNSMAAADIPGWMFPNHEKAIPTQLRDGVRGFLIDVHYGVPIGDHVKTLIEDETVSMEKYEEALGKEGVEAAMRIRARLVGPATGKREVYLGHGFCELGAERFVEALEAMNEFMVANPGEVIIIIIQDEGVTPEDVAACFAESGLDRFVYRGPVTPPWPTLGEMVARDERVLVCAENNARGVPWYHSAFEVFQETPYRFEDPSQFSNRPNRGGTSSPLLLLNHWIETTPAPKPSNAEIVNAYDVLYKRAVACRKKRGMMPTLIAVDFYRSGDLFAVVDALNGFKRPPTGPSS